MVVTALRRRVLDGLRRARVKVSAPIRRLSLAGQFALVCLVVLVVGAFVIGTWVSRKVESGVVRRTAAMTALYVDSFISPYLAVLEAGEGLDDQSLQALSGLLEGSALRREIVSFKVWAPDGTVLFATDNELIGQRFAPSPGLEKALRGSVESGMSDLSSAENEVERRRWSRLVETYSPVLASDGSVVAAVEFYESPAELMAEVRSSRREAWVIVSLSTFVMYVVLVGLVGRASATIKRQHGALREAVDDQVTLREQVHALNRRLRRVAADKSRTDEELMRRLAQDLHDGPAQDLALALLKLDDSAASSIRAADEQTVRDALEHSLQEIRSITSELRLPQLDGQGWRGTVVRAVDDHRRRTGAAVQVEAADIVLEPTEPQRIAVYRVVQEALSNAARHSGTIEQWVGVHEEAGWAVLTITDRGRGFDPTRPPRAGRRARLGLQGMRERVEVLGGQLALSSEPGHGTTVTARFHLEGGEET